jgi:mRNA interferase MazF
MTRKFNFGEIWLADLNPKVGTELGKLRPVLIIQNQILLEINHPSTLIIPLTTKLIDDTEPLRIRIKAQYKLEKDSDLLIDQIRAIDNKRLTIGPLMICDNQFMKKVYKAISEVIGNN